MKNKIFNISIILFFFLFSCSNKKKEYYKNNKLKSEVEIYNNVPNGLYKIYYDTGILKEKGFYKYGIKKDTLHKYFKSGKLSELNIFQSQNYLSIFKYNEKGILIEKGTLKKKDTLGWWYYYSNKGKLTYQKNYWNVKGNKFINQKIMYNPKGEIDKTKSKYYTISKDKNYLEYYSPYSNISLGNGRYLWLIVIDTIGKPTINNIISDTLYPLPLTSNKFKMIKYKFAKGFIKEKVLIDTIVNAEKVTIIRDLNTFFIYSEQSSSSKH